MLIAILAGLSSPARVTLAAEPPAMEKIRVSDDGSKFVYSESGKTFVPWGFNYVGRFGEIIEDSWHEDWPRVEKDFRQMRSLGGNVARIHLQFGTYMTGPDQFNQEQLDRLREMCDLGQAHGLYLDLTGLNLFRLDDIPAWYDELDEAERWEVQERWWAKIAETCAGHPAVFCYDLMNEPVLGGKPKEGEPRWVGGELGGFYFVQRISGEAKGRTSIEIAEAWSKKLTTAIRQQDPHTPITVGAIPWAHVWPAAKPLFYSPEVSKHYDFVSIHLYPGHEKVKEAVAALAVYDIGKPLVVEETFPLGCTIEEMDQFIDGGRDRVDGWISHYFGYTPEEHRNGAEPHGTTPDDPFQMSVGDFLEYWRDKGKEISPPVQDEGKGAGASTPANPPAQLIVRGSVEQIHILHATPGSDVVVWGPSGFDVVETTDNQGGLVLTDYPPGEGYRVTVDGQGHEVRVLRPDEHPPAEFYAAQKLPPTSGYIKTRDGTLLSYRVVLPDPAAHGPGPYDLVITYSGYQPGLDTENGYQDQPFEKFNSLGYAVAGVNMRGSGCSGGAFRFMEPLTWLDGYDMIEALSAQEWVDDVALGDQSWPGLTQLYVASTQPPSLDAIVPGSVVGDFYRDVFYPGGIPNVGFGLIWGAGRDVENAFPSRRKEVMARVASDPICAANQGLRGQNVNLLETIKTHPFDGPYWQGRSAERLVERIKVPVLQIVSWQDPQVGGRPAMLFERFDKRAPRRLVGINGFHQYYSGPVWSEIVRFLDIYLGDHPPEKVAEYESENRFVALLEANAKSEVRGRFTLPNLAAAGDGERFVLGTDLEPDRADSQGTSSTFFYDAAKPGSWVAPTQDQVRFTSRVLDQHVAMAGPGSVDLWIAVDAADVDLQATLSEVRPDGYEMLVQSGWLRASHRALDTEASTPLRPVHLHTEESLENLAPGEWTKVRIELFPFAHVFRAGSRIRLGISGPGGGSNAWPWAYDALPGGFDVCIGHDNVHASALVLPVVTPQDLDLSSTLPPHDGVVAQLSRPVATATAPKPEPAHQP